MLKGNRLCGHGSMNPDIFHIFRCHLLANSYATKLKFHVFRENLLFVFKTTSSIEWYINRKLVIEGFKNFKLNSD